jgi:hypothetical protein
LLIYNRLTHIKSLSSYFYNYSKSKLASAWQQSGAPPPTMTSPPVMGAQIVAPPFKAYRPRSVLKVKSKVF